jgi:predicted GH43/DUF377 family glycosyl hydrolase
MVKAKRSHHNPILLPDTKNAWEAEAAFNGSIIRDETAYTMVYRAIGVEELYDNVRMKRSTVGLAQSGDGIHFKRRTQFLVPEKEWEKYGCEDPRITKLEDTYYIMYTAISTWPPDVHGIKIAVAVTKDLRKVEERHLVTFFNAKAAVLFPERVNGKIAMFLTVHTDRPPSKICLALFDSPEQMWDEKFWRDWYDHLDEHVVKLLHTTEDLLEIGAVPVKTEQGWILVFAYVQNYFKNPKLFRIDAALLDLNDPQKVIGQTVDPILVPQEEYEIYGQVPNTIFPSGAMLEEGQFFIYYGACDTTVCRVSITLNDLLDELINHPVINPAATRRSVTLERFAGNPIISPIREHSWESKYTFNPGAIYAGGKVHIFYRAMGDDDTSVFGYASTKDGMHLEERLPEPVYVPREKFEKKHQPGFSGVEDARLTAIGDTIYMCYTAYEGISPPRIALTKIGYEDFLARKREAWSKPVLISSPGTDNKDSCVFPDRINGRYALVHRITPCIWLDYVSDLDFGGDQWLGGRPIMAPRTSMWDSLKIGLGGPVIKTEDGWVMMYHGVSKYDNKYRLGAALLDLENPLKVVGRLHNPLLEPREWYENKGYREGTTFDNGNALIGDTLFVYYGGADQYTGVAFVSLKELLAALKSGK